MKYQISDLIDLPALQKLMDSFYEATGIIHALIDNDSRVLTASGWEPVCTDFHRENPRACQRCEASDRYVLDHLHDGTYVGYQCLNGLNDYAVPVVIGGEHLANVFTGQIFHAPPDLDFFRAQAAEFGFNANSSRMRKLYDLTRTQDILFKRLTRGINHDTAKTCFNRFPAGLKLKGMIEVQSDTQRIGIFSSTRRKQALQHADSNTGAKV